MASALEKKAKEAYVDDDFELAVDLNTQALALDPKNAVLYADRAQANIKLRNFTEAVADANRAIELNSSLSKAYLRKGVACMELEEYQTAKAALEIGASLGTGESRFTNLIKECEKHIAEEAGNLSQYASPNQAASVEAQQPNVDSDGAVTSEAADLTPAQTSSGPKPKFRHDIYNGQNEVVLTIFAKGIPDKDVTVQFGEQILSVGIEIPGDDSYNFEPRLFGKIIPEKCRYQVLSTKIEIRLWKADPIAWTSLEYSKNKVPQKINATPVQGSQRPAYPSSKSKVDWDKLVADVKKEEKEEKLDGGAALNKFFCDIYRDADEDTKRAMSKSFVESNGTVLSTNWKEVGAKKVESTPPDGMELKKWEY